MTPYSRAIRRDTRSKPICYLLHTSRRPAECNPRAALIECPPHNDASVRGNAQRNRFSTAQGAQVLHSARSCPAEGALAGVFVDSNPHNDIPILRDAISDAFSATRQHAQPSNRRLLRPRNGRHHRQHARACQRLQPILCHRLHRSSSFSRVSATRPLQRTAIPIIAHFSSTRAVPAPRFSNTLR
jgi:hypothetical protein